MFVMFYNTFLINMRVDSNYIRTNTVQSLPTQTTRQCEPGSSQELYIKMVIDLLTNSKFISDPLKAMISLLFSSGIRVSELEHGLLSKAGIREGFVITKIDGKQINDVGDVKHSLENKSGGVLIEGVYPNGMRAYYGFEL